VRQGVLQFGPEALFAATTVTGAFSLGVSARF